MKVCFDTISNMFFTNKGWMYTFSGVYIILKSVFICICIDSTCSPH